ncbi:hypothetical protein HPB51_026349 [Rhipicephalus microplus]|uniref:Uncharacterized protein n=1 Tax=Rhipicephalus microplus TaxID=6941 RepID=A0A9J6D3G5_RHIMP|nr:hypothetical protein HPB51_026349 [Rhipicephalus microplus]
MCTRVCKAKTAPAAIDAPCVNSTWVVNTTPNYCNSSLNPYANPSVDATQNVVVGTSKQAGPNDVLSTFESQFTINSKFCEINKLYGNLDLGLALYDIECEDLELGCLVPTAGIYETNRFGNVSQHTHKLVNDGVASACPWLVSPAEVPAATLGRTLWIYDDEIAVPPANALILTDV